MATWEIEVDTTLYRIPNPDSADVINTCQKIGQKRALVAAVLVVTNCSDAFTQDLEEISTEGIDTGGHAVGTQAAADHVRDTKLKDVQYMAGLPPELQRIVSKLEEPGYLVDGLRIIKDQLEKALPSSGQEEYRRILKKHGWEKGTGTTLTAAIARPAILEMYQVIEFANAQKAQTVDGKFTANDSDVPDIIGGKQAAFDTLDEVKK